ncbi:MAG: hypothetical protein JW828_15100 [Sedimentisphaerales bacterium]|nr:hypothetical protein [Sedimentisphaerales bacterium]
MAEEYSDVVYEVHELPHLKKQIKTEAHGHCEKCLYWQSLKNGFPTPENNVRGRIGDHIGECRFGAPHPTEQDAHWPVTYDFDWCGMFKARAGTGGLAGMANF